MNEDMPSKPLKMKPKLIEKISHSGTDIMSFKFSRTDDQIKNNYINYKDGQYAIVDLGTTEDPEGPIRSFTLASSTTESER
jgi:ferredoxin-NADP reductase